MKKDQNEVTTAQPHGQNLAAYPYAPEVEARRADYENLAEALLAMMEIRFARRPGEASLDPPDFQEDQSEEPLGGGIIAHFEQVKDNIDFCDPVWMRRFYVELRLHHDQRELEHEQRQQHRAAVPADWQQVQSDYIS